MTQAVIDIQSEAVEELVEVFKSKHTTTFKAPTGSGKTYMMGAFMHEILSEDKDAVFVVSSLSKGNLAEQNHQSFMRFKERFPTLKPYLIESDTDKKIEGALYIPTDYNVYVLPRDLYKEKSRLKQGALIAFLRTQQGFKDNEELKAQGYIQKRLYLIKDECHIATNNLDSLIKRNPKGVGYFEKVLNVSATPSLAKNQHPDVQIGEDRAIESQLIKEVEYRDEREVREEKRLSGALRQFVELKQKYLELIAINPCLIIQISNKDKAENELKIIKSVLGSLEFSHLKYMYISEKEAQCDSNDALKAKKLPPKKWRDYAKENSSSIDVIIFKMVISEGWDIPRACMLYQMRDTKSTQLTEQVIGRIRRNPRLLDFERLDKEAQELILKAYVYGVKPEEQSSIGVKLKGENAGGIYKNEIQEEFKIHTTRLRHREQNLTYSAQKIESVLKNSNGIGAEDIFTRYKNLNSNKELESLCAVYYQSAEERDEQIARWFALSGNAESIKKALSADMCDYEKNMIIEPPKEIGCESVLPLQSTLNKSGYNKKISKWIWESAEKEVFYFDSEAEKEWIEILLNLRDEDAPNGERLIKRIQINQEKIYLLGKNFLSKSNLKFEYYCEGYHFSYPDFVLKDWKDRIHIFEVKSMRGGEGANFDTKQYEKKLESLKKCYEAVSSKLPYHFYIPTQTQSDWNVWYAYEGKEESIDKEKIKGILAKD